MLTFALIILASIGITLVGCGMVLVLYVLSYSRPVKEEPHAHELTKKELDAIFVQIIENEKAFRSWRWRYITAGSNARYL